MSEVGDRLGLLNIITNGLIPSRTASVFTEVARLTRGVPLFVSISLEPTDAMYTTVRGIKGGYALARQSLAELERIQASEPHMKSGYLITLSDMNAEVLDSMQYVGTEGLDNMTIGVVTNAQVLTRGMKNVKISRSSPHLASALDRIWRNYDLRSPLNLPPKIFLGLMRRFLRTNRSPLPCSAGQDVLSIDAYGNVMQCFHIGKPLVKLRDWDFDIPRICRSEEYRRALAPTLACRDCWQACQAYPSIFRNPVSAIVEYAREVRRWRREQRHVEPGKQPQPQTTPPVDLPDLVE